MNEKLIYIGLAVIGILGPIAFPDYIMQFAVLWIMVIMASTWDITGGQMGYNSLGNIAFFGIGMYISACIQVSMFYDLEDPIKFAKDVYKSLDDNGVFIAQLMCLNSMIEQNDLGNICHEHLEYYSSKVIINLAKKNGLKVFDIKRNDINGGSKQFYICLKSSKYLVNNRILQNELSEEKRYKLSDPKTFKKFFKEINLIKIKLLSMIKKIKKKGQSIHCYGASTKGNVLLQYFGIDNKFIDFVAERNKKKYNLYTPGTKIKIISEKSSRSLKPDYYLVLPWHFKKEIVLREKEAIKKGTRFIFPLPKLNII